MRAKNNQLKLNQEKARPMPMGATVTSNGVNFAVTAEREAELFLYLYREGDSVPLYQFPIPPENRMGEVRYIYIEGLHPRQWEYNFFCKKKTKDGRVVEVPLPDPYAKKVLGREQWGTAAEEPLRYGFLTDKFDWQQDKPPEIPLEDTILYRLHTRGFTKHSSSRVKGKGTFSGIREKIPYLKELGITMIELMPSYEFDERILTQQGEERLNYFGYADAYYFAPKASYTRIGNRRGKKIEKAKELKAVELIEGKEAVFDTEDRRDWKEDSISRRNRYDPENELKELVRALHQAGIEISMEFYFEPGLSMEFVSDCLIFWKMEYHIDAFHVNQNGVNMNQLAKNAYLSDCKLFGNEWDTDFIYPKEPKVRRLAAMNDGFMMDMRRFLKSDENQIGGFLYRLTRNPAKEGVINYIANHDSLTLLDMVMYEKRHNEANGENNQDGNPFNYSWNCGVEGESRRKKILDRRSQQMKNAVVMVLLSQGIPMLFAGDEFARTCQGNNNPYCQDNEISWLNWNFSKRGQELYEFTKALIAFRMAHRILHMPKQLRMMDYSAVGRPDLSYHGSRAWYPDMDTYTRYVGVFYCGEYARYTKDKKADEDIFIAYNCHWEEHKFDLPRPSKKKVWKEAIHTFCGEEPFVAEEPVVLKEQRQLIVPARSIIVLISAEKDSLEE